MAGSNSKIVEKKEVIPFGGHLSYFLFTVKSLNSFYSFTNDLAERCQTRFTLADSYMFPNDKMQAQFQMAYTQFDNSIREEVFFENTADKVNMVVFQNYTTDFIKPKSVANPMESMGLFSASEDECRCFALNKTGLAMHRWGLPNIEFFVMIYSRPHQGADRLADYFAHFPYNSQNLTDLLQGEIRRKQDAEGNEIITRKKTNAVLFLHDLFGFADRQINNGIQRRIAQRNGIVPDSLKMPRLPGFNFI